MDSPPDLPRAAQPDSVVAVGAAVEGAEMSKIEWCDESVAVWIGCDRVSPACGLKHDTAGEGGGCYAEVLDARFYARWGGKHWGKHAPRYETKGWRDKLAALDRKAQRERRRLRVFVNELSDTFERREDLDGLRSELWDAIVECEHLEFLLLTKRARFMHTTLAGLMDECPELAAVFRDRVALGVTVEDQQYADLRIPWLLKCGEWARYLWLSCEPLLGGLALQDRWLHGLFDHCPIEGDGDPNTDCVGCPGWGMECGAIRGPSIGWVVIGSESGSGARPCDLSWVRDIVARCDADGVDCFVKQWLHDGSTDAKGGAPADWPASIRVRAYPPGAGLRLEPLPEADQALLPGMPE